MHKFINNISRKLLQFLKSDVEKEAGIENQHTGRLTGTVRCEYKFSNEMSDGV